VIRVEMCVDDERDLHCLGVGERDVRVDIIGARIDDGTPAERAAAEQV
jgi:hypothetical protein